MPIDRRSVPAGASAAARAATPSVVAFPLALTVPVALAFALRLAFGLCLAAAIAALREDARCGKSQEGDGARPDQELLEKSTPSGGDQREQGFYAAGGILRHVRLLWRTSYAGCLDQ